jgi:urease subunit gamma/beta
MHLTPKDVEKLMLHTACMLAQKRYARGLLLNYPEALALLSGQLLEFIRDGKTLAQLSALGKEILGCRDVMPGVPQMISQVQVEGTFTDGTKLVSVHHPISREEGNPKLALHGSGLTKTSVLLHVNNCTVCIPGAIETLSDPILYNNQQLVLSLAVTNTGTRSVQVGSHCLFHTANRALTFDRAAAVNHRLNIPAGTAVRFKPGETKTVELIRIPELK